MEIYTQVPDEATRAALKRLSDELSGTVVSLLMDELFYQGTIVAASIRTWLRDPVP